MKGDRHFMLVEYWIFILIVFVVVLAAFSAKHRESCLLSAETTADSLFCLHSWK